MRKTDDFKNLNLQLPFQIFTPIKYRNKKNWEFMNLKSNTGTFSCTACSLINIFVFLCSEIIYVIMVYIETMHQFCSSKSNIWPTVYAVISDQDTISHQKYWMKCQTILKIVIYDLFQFGKICSSTYLIISNTEVSNNGGQIHR